MRFRSPWLDWTPPPSVGFGGALSKRVQNSGATVSGGSENVDVLPAPPVFQERFTYEPTKPPKGSALLINSRVLGEAVWLVEDDAHAEELERELAAEGDHRLVFTLAEVGAMAGMLAADMRALVHIKRHLPGSRVDAVTLRHVEPVQ
jgi:hypothetical protein